MIWFYFALLTVVTGSVANIFRRVLMKDDTSDPIASAIVFQWVGATIIGFFAIWHGFVLPPITKYPINFILQAILWGSATLSLFKASQFLEASETAILTTASSVVTIVGAVLLLGEHFSLMYVIGTVCILFSIFLISYRKGVMKFNKGTMYALIYCLLAGLGYANDAYMIKFSHSDTLSLLTLGFFAPGVFMSIVRPSALTKLQTVFTKRHFPKVFLLTFFYAIASIAYFFAIATGGQASQVSPINQSQIIATVILGAIFLKEKDHIIKKVVCAILVTIGVLLLR